MSWKERVEQELNAREAKRAQDEAARTAAQNQTDRALQERSARERRDRQRLIDTFEGLDVPGQFGEVNHDIWKGRGEVAAQGQQVKLNATAQAVVPKYENFTAIKHGTFTTPDRHHDFRVRTGLYAQPMHRVVGHEMAEGPEHSLVVNLTAEDGIVTVVDSHEMDLKTVLDSYPDLKLRNTSSGEGYFSTPDGRVSYGYYGKGVLAVKGLAESTNPGDEMSKVVETGIIASSIARASDPLGQAQKDTQQRAREIDGQIGQASATTRNAKSILTTSSYGAFEHKDR